MSRLVLHEVCTIPLVEERSVGFAILASPPILNYDIMIYFPVSFHPNDRPAKLSSPKHPLG
eukprot:13256754-Heterocapsa_arctica.AAC.1